jgi:hypothetical protein
LLSRLKTRNGWIAGCNLKKNFDIILSGNAIADRFGAELKEEHEMSGGKYRPVLKLPRPLLDNLLEIAAVAGLLGMLLIVWAAWPQLPVRLPTHFGLSGLPDAWGGRGSLLFLPIVGFFLYVMMTVIYRYPQIYNYPVKLTEANVERLYRRSRSLIQWLKAEILWLFWYLEWQTIQIGLGKSGGLGGAFLPILLLVLVVTTGVSIWQSTHPGDNAGRGGSAGTA